jgi:hypothetical protein
MWNPRIKEEAPSNITHVNENTYMIAKVRITCFSHTEPPAELRALKRWLAIYECIAIAFTVIQILL